MKSILMIFGIVSLVFMISCQKDPATSSFTLDCSGGTKLFNADVKPLIQSNCISCHAQYSTYSQISASKISIRSAIVDGSMPRNGSLSSDQKNKIVCWIDNGALNN